LLSLCELQSVLGGNLSSHLVDPNNYEPSKAQSLVLRYFALLKDFMTFVSNFGSPHLAVAFSFQDAHSNLQVSIQLPMERNVIYEGWLCCTFPLCNSYMTIPKPTTTLPSSLGTFQPSLIIAILST
jgi:hypothetical protein